MASNYDRVIQQLRAAGLLVERIEATGRVVRCKVDGDREKRGWYCLHEIRGQLGDDLLVGSFGVWRGNDNGATKVALDGGQLSAEQTKALRERLREDARKAAAARKRSAETAARRAEHIWRRCRHDAPDTCDYLARKGIQGHGVRYTDKGAVVLAMHDGQGRVHGLQFILSRRTQGERIKRLGRDKEYWPPGLAKQGHWFQIGSPAGVVLLCEGYATGASLHEATGLPTAVAFDAGNLAPVAAAMRKRYPAAKVLVCADDDFATLGNPGIDAASAASLAVGGAWIAPSFRDERQVELRRQIAALGELAADDHRARVADILRHAGSAKATDFNDLHAIEGLLLVRQQIEGKLDALGWRAAGPSARHPTAGGEGRGDKPGWHFDMEVLLQTMTLIYGTDTVFDAARSRIIGLGPLRSAAGKGLVRQWLEHPDRATVLPEEVGFDPGGEAPDVRCNLWAGWPTTPQAGRCERLLDLLQWLCDGETRSSEIYEWVLRWLAYPLQHPGAKMQTSLLVHGPEGTGKNTFFGVIRRIYGRYGTQFSQVELESNFNGWASGKLFALGNEVVSRSELYHIQGRLKSMITEPEWVINEKMLPARSEANHCNFVFFSNRIDIAKLDQGDRRYCVLWTPPAAPPDYYREVAAEIADGGVAALHHHLLHLDLGDFSPHAKPPETQAKADLVELGMDSTERFWRDWTAGEIDGLPCVPCRTNDLYDAYRIWCQREGIARAAQKQTLLTAVGKKARVRKQQERYWVNGVEEKRTVLHPPDAAVPDGESARAWLGQQVLEFQGGLNAYRERI